MAFNLQAIVGNATVSLSDRNPFALRFARGLGSADVRRVTARGPAQHGDTDLGYRLGQRDIELVIGFFADTDAALDAHRDTLMSILKPLPNTPIKLRMTRDDGEIRQIDCNVSGRVDIRLIPQHRPGHYHEATIRLRAPDPAFYNPTPGTASFAGSVSYAANWWLAGGAIPSSQVVFRGGTPGLDEAWPYSGTIASSTTWTLALRAGYVSNTGTAAYMFNSTFGTIATPNQPGFGAYGQYQLYRWMTYNYQGSAAMTPGTQTYFMHNDPAGLVLGGTTYSSHRVSWLAPGNYVGFDIQPAFILGTAMAWRKLGWSAGIPLYALYSPGLTEGQRNALSVYMAGNAGTADVSLTVPYEGDLPEYPVISITGPITGPSVVNTATGDALDFGTVVIGAGTTYVIDTRPGYRDVLMGTVSKRFELTDDSDLGTWYLAPNPIATGGTNLINLEGSNIGGSTSLSIVYYDRYSSG